MSLQSVSKTILVLETFLKFPDGRASVSELAREVGWSRAATHQYVSTLAEVGWLVQNAKRHYQLSPRAAVFGRFAIEYAAVPPQVSQAMEELVDVLNEPISYAVLNGDEATIIERHEPKRPFSMSAEPHLDLRTSASGMALLAFDSHVDESSINEMGDTLNAIRERGYAQSHSEWLGDIVDVVAVPIMSRDECLGAMSVIAPEGRLNIPLARKELLAARVKIEAAIESAQVSIA